MSLTVLVAFTCLTITLVHEVYRPNDFYQKHSVNSNTAVVAKWILGDDEEDTHKNHTHYRSVKTKTEYVRMAWAPYKINNPNICKGADKISVIVLVHTSPDHFWIRTEMRRTWLNSTHYSPESVRVVFLLGLVTKPFIQNKIEQESKMYGDIVQGDFVDSYRNLTNKGVMGYRWVTEHCMNAEILIKVDDDAIINFFKYFENIRDGLVKKKKHIFCNKILPNTMPIIRQKNSKWFVSFDEYRNYTLYPHTYCSGFVVFISIDLVPSLYHAGIASPFFWVDDFFLFGLLPSRVKNVTFTNFRGNLTFQYPDGVKCYKQQKSQCKYLVMPAKKREIPIMWNAITADRVKSKVGYYFMSLNGNNHVNTNSMYNKLSQNISIIKQNVSMTAQSNRKVILADTKYTRTKTNSEIKAMNANKTVALITTQKQNTNTTNIKAQGGG